MSSKDFPRTSAELMLGKDGGAELDQLPPFALNAAYPVFHPHKNPIEEKDHDENFGCAVVRQIP